MTWHGGGYWYGVTRQMRRETKDGEVNVRGGGNLAIRAMKIIYWANIFRKIQNIFARY